MTTPAPTVRPPSRIAKRIVSSIAIGAISVTVIFTLSPGITISVPSGSCTEPVTSVVRCPVDLYQEFRWLAAFVFASRLLTMP